MRVADGHKARPCTSHDLSVAVQSESRSIITGASSPVHDIFPHTDPKDFKDVGFADYAYRLSIALQGRILCLPITA